MVTNDVFEGTACLLELQPIDISSSDEAAGQVNSSPERLGCIDCVEVGPYAASFMYGNSSLLDDVLRASEHSVPYLGRYDQEI